MSKKINTIITFHLECLKEVAIKGYASSLDQLTSGFIIGAEFGLMAMTLITLITGLTAK